MFRIGQHKNMTRNNTNFNINTAATLHSCFDNSLLLADPLLDGLHAWPNDLVHVLHVRPEHSVRLVAIAAHGTHKGPLARVLPLVCQQGCAALEHLLAEAALELGLPVLLLVVPNLGGVAKALPTELALILLII